MITTRKYIHGRWKWAPLLCALALNGGGCFSLQFNAKPGDLTNVQPTSTQPRVGNVYMLRGWLGIFSCGLDDIQKQVQAQGISSHIFLDDQWHDLAAAIRQKYKGRTDREPLVLVGHSYGADDALRIANELETDGIRVDLLVSLEPLEPPAAGPNIRWCSNIYQSTFPLLTQGPGPARMDNFNVRKNRTDLWVFNTNHFNLPNNPKVQHEVLLEMLQVCEPRQQWLAARSTPAAPVRDP